jgi:pSer/pThr/pTyr-binding forkhead associated (FHA) protein
MNQDSMDNHILRIYDQPEPRQILLKAATYSLGRDKHNSIVIPNRGISRQHALLLRMPLPANAGYRYRIIDGNAVGNPSLNGISINGVECTQHDLSPGDRIFIGGLIQIDYQILSLPNGRQDLGPLRIQTPSYQSIKAKPVSASTTFVNIENFQVSELLRTGQDVLTLDEFVDDQFVDDLPPTEMFDSRF